MKIVVAGEVDLPAESREAALRGAFARAGVLRNARASVLVQHSGRGHAQVSRGFDGTGSWGGRCGWRGICFNSLTPCVWRRYLRLSARLDRIFQTD